MPRQRADIRLAGETPVEKGVAVPLTGRIGGVPGAALRELVLEPQFAHDVTHLLPHYVQVEKVLLAEYARMGVLDAEQVEQIATVLGSVTGDSLVADSAGNLSDVALALERHVTARCAAPSWHVDRSRNDLQACVQLITRGHSSECTGGGWKVASSQRRVTMRQFCPETNQSSKTLCR
ncbi:hypothetical protein [Actinophytocola glycyrrhizae]|uniref:Uncharacterized protein n=1 Tax=Actinophytocola glycyrrhizae TaxID=2044873 RepID=A0ABV9S938_9PSEU